MEETRAVFPSLRKRIADALQRLQDQLEDGAGSAKEEVQRAREVLAAAKEAQS
jgi:tubulin-specific chaperone A